MATESQELQLQSFLEGQIKLCRQSGQTDDLTADQLQRSGFDSKAIQAAFARLPAPGTRNDNSGGIGLNLNPITLLSGLIWGYEQPKPSPLSGNRSIKNGNGSPFVSEEDFLKITVNGDGSPTFSPLNSKSGSPLVLSPSTSVDGNSTPSTPLLPQFQKFQFLPDHQDFSNYFQDMIILCKHLRDKKISGETSLMTLQGYLADGNIPKLHEQFSVELLRQLLLTENNQNMVDMNTICQKLDNLITFFLSENAERIESRALAKRLLPQTKILNLDPEFDLGEGFGTIAQNVMNDLLVAIIGQRLQCPTIADADKLVAALETLNRQKPAPDR